MNALLTKRNLIIGAISSFAITTLYFGLNGNEPAMVSHTSKAPKQPLADPVAAVSRAATKLAKNPDGLLEVTAEDADAQLDEELVDEAKLRIPEEESELRQAIASLENELAKGNVIQRLNRNEVDPSEREMIKETFLELNELRSDLLRSKLGEIEEKMRLLEEDEEHV